jgi:hypothetical protein
MFTREFDPLNLPMLLISSLFLVNKFHNNHEATVRPLRLTAGENFMAFRRVFKAVGETRKYVDWIQHRSIRFTDVLYSARQKSSKSLDLCSNTNADQILIFSQTPYFPLFVQPKHGTSFEG